MTEQAEGYYFANRELAERTMSRRANNRQAEAIHRELADRYEALALVFGAKPRSQVGLENSLASNSDDKQEIVELDQLSAELTRSLERCRKLLFDFRSDVAANTSMPELLDDGNDEARSWFGGGN